MKNQEIDEAERSDINFRNRLQVCFFKYIYSSNSFTCL